jgi:hypothetical protein
MHKKNIAGVKGVPTAVYSNLSIEYKIILATNGGPSNTPFPNLTDSLVAEVQLRCSLYDDEIRGIRAKLQEIP